MGAAAATNGSGGFASYGRGTPIHSALLFSLPLPLPLFLFLLFSYPPPRARSLARIRTSCPSSLYSLLPCLPTQTLLSLVPVDLPATNHAHILTLHLLSFCAYPTTSPVQHPPAVPFHRRLALRASTRSQTTIHRCLLCDSNRG